MMSEDLNNKKEQVYQNCWEFMNCPEEVKLGCKVYINDFGKECYMLQDIKNICPKSIDLNNCEDCGWYKILVKDDQGLVS